MKDIDQNEIIENEERANIEGLSGLLNATLAQFNVIQNADNTTDQKANNIMAASFVVIVLLASYMRDGDGAFRIMPIISMAVLLVVILLIINLTWQREYSGAIADLQENEDYYGKDNESLLVQLIVDANNAIDKNNSKLQEKQDKFRWALVIFILGLAIGILSLFIDLKFIII